MAKIAVFAGHGGSDFGAISNGLYEKNLALEIMTETTSELRRRGYEVINNRTSDVDRDLNSDIRLANRENVDAVIEIHLNSNLGTPGSGTETFYSVTGKGKNLAEAINDNLVALGFVLPETTSENSRQSFSPLHNESAVSVSDDHGAAGRDHAGP